LIRSTQSHGIIYYTIKHW